jgi:DNA-binding transcriptional ArsR family regulator
MARKSPKSLKSRIDALINAVGETPPPSFAKIKSELVTCAGLAEALEDGAAVRKAKAKIARLESALEKSNAENSNLKVELQEASAKIERFKAEQKQREQKEREIPEIQFEILERLPSEQSGDYIVVSEVARRIGKPIDETEVHIRKLEKAGLVIGTYEASDALVWRRSITGNELVLAKRLAGEDQGQKKPDQQGNLSVPEQIVLLVVARNKGIAAPEILKKVARGLPTATLPLIDLLLITLREKKMATDGNAPDYGAPRRWIALRDGLEYLAERGLL